MKNNISKVFGERLISITEVSAATGIARSTLTNMYYRRNSAIHIKTVEKLCDYLQVPMSELFEYEPAQQDKSEV